MAYVKHATLTAGVVSTLTFSVNAGRVEILNADGAAEVYCRTDGTNPTVGGDNCHLLPAVINAIEVADESSGDTVVKLISAGTPRVSVTVR